MSEWGSTAIREMLRDLSWCPPDQLDAFLRKFLKPVKTPPSDYGPPAVKDRRKWNSVGVWKVRSAIPDIAHYTPTNQEEDHQ